MAESFFTSGNQIVTTEIDVDSPYTEGLISKVKGRDVELSNKIIGLGGTGIDGDVTITANTNLSGIKHYNNFTINAGVTVTIDQGKPLIIFARGTVTINGTIEGDGKGGLGGTGIGSYGLFGGSGASGGSDPISIVLGYNGGNSAHYWRINGGIASFPGGGIGQDGIQTTDKLTHLPNVGPSGESLGGASGGAGCNANASYGRGGNGGGFVYIEAPTVIINTMAIIRCNGNNGVNGRSGYSQAGGGGGGGGGVIFIRLKNITNNGTLSVTAGYGGNGYGYGAGGAGGAGVVYLEIVP